MRLLVAVSLLVLAGCSRNSIDAINLANEADKEKSSNPDDAISKYQQAANLDPDNASIAYRLGLAYERKEAWSDEVATLAKAEAADKKAHGKYTYASYWAHDGYAMSKLAAAGQGSWADARTRLETAIQLDPKYADAYYDLGDVLRHMDQESDALTNYTKAIEIKPDKTDYYSALASLYDDLLYFDQAAQVYNEGLTFAKPDDKHVVEFWMGLGNIAEQKHDLNGAITDYGKAKTACGGPCADHPELYFYLGYAQSSADPPKAEGKQNLTTFLNGACKGAGAKKMAEQCAQAQDVLSRVYTK